MAQWGKSDANTAAPKYTTNATTGESGQVEFGTKVFGIDAAEAGVANGPASPGWVRAVAGTGGRSGRILYETLVASRTLITGDAADDTLFPEPAAPVNTVLPAITGTAQVGQTLTSTTGTWTGYPTPTYARQWKKGGVNIAGATAATYVPVIGDIGGIITVTVTATSTSGTASATSAGTSAVIAA